MKDVCVCKYSVFAKSLFPLLSSYENKISALNGILYSLKEQLNEGWKFLFSLEHETLNCLHSKQHNTGLMKC